MTTGYDVIVVGARCAGSPTAMLLARKGHRVLLVDRATFPSDTLSTLVIHAPGVAALRRWGLLDEVRATGCPPIERYSFDFGPFTLVGRPRPIDGVATGYAPRRTLLDSVLVGAAGRAGAEVRERFNVDQLVVENGTVVGIRGHGPDGRRRPVRARLVIGADGLRSVTARAVGRRRHGSLRRYALVAHVADVLDLGDTAELHVSGAGYVGLNPVGEGLANVALVVPRDRLAGLTRDPTTFFFDMLERFPGVRGRVRRDRLARRVLATGPFGAWTAPVTAPGALLAGDAADFFDPFTGEGICAALRGAELIEQAMLPSLTGSRTQAAGLGAYRASRRQAFAGKWAVERLIGYAMLLPGLFDRAVERLERRGLSHTLIGVTGDYLPARHVLNPRFLSQVML